MPDTLHNSLVHKYLQLLLHNERLYDGHWKRMRFDDFILPISLDYKSGRAKPYPVPRSLEGKSQELFNILLASACWRRYMI